MAAEPQPGLSPATSDIGRKVLGLCESVLGGSRAPVVEQNADGAGIPVSPRHLRVQAAFCVSPQMPVRQLFSGR